MTSFPAPRRSAALVGSLALSIVSIGALITPAPVQAQGREPYFVAELAQPTAHKRIVARGTVWQCRETRCEAERSPVRPMQACRGLSDAAGTIAAFSRRAIALSEGDLARCNG